MARITVEKCLEHVPSRFDLILLASGRARQLSTTSREPMVEANKDKNTLIALREIEEVLIDAETLFVVLSIFVIFTFRLWPIVTKSDGFFTRPYDKSLT